ncbi:unnamed protein product [Cuscuta epithymum]|uniref:Myb-like domain-containing protein n=1 Tax=Cuscuta epithymum TaxID=186058 RepID=A0AAV0D229_9ASTE|nr:unnamed protein product [Cuscuta epithymum]
MDSQDSEIFSSSQYIHTIPSQLSSQSLHPTPPIQPTYNFNQSSGVYPYFVDQYGSKIPFQSVLNSPILNTPMPNAQFESSSTKTKKKGNDTRIVSQPAILRKEWTKEEDVALTEAWLNVSMDSDIGNNQKSTASRYFSDCDFVFYTKHVAVKKLKARFECLMPGLPAYLGWWLDLQRQWLAAGGTTTPVTAVATAICTAAAVRSETAAVFGVAATGGDRWRVPATGTGDRQWSGVLVGTSTISKLQGCCCLVTNNNSYLGDF